MLQVQNLFKNFGIYPILNDLSISFPQNQKIAIYGRNGSGKSTFLNILCSLDHKDSGTIVLPKNAVIGFLPQEPNPNPKKTILEECISGREELCRLKEKLDKILEELENYNDKNHEDLLHQYEATEEEYKRKGGYSLESEGKKILYGLGLKDFDQFPGNLSGGMRMRLELSKLFLKNPNILILDEPTNHLDLPSLAWMERYLTSYKGTLIFVSHDRDLLNNLATYIVHLQKGKVDLYKGNFDSFIFQRNQKLELNSNMKTKLSKKRMELETFVSRFGAKATKAKQAQSKKKMIDRMLLLEEELNIDTSESNASFKLPVPPPSGRVVLELEDYSIGYESNKLIDPFDLKLEKGQRVAIIGANGIGKSSFLKTIIGINSPLTGDRKFGHKVEPFYLAQDQSEQLNLDQTVLDNLLDSNESLSVNEARKILGGFLFSGDFVEKKAAVLSGGEKNRLGFARLLSRKTNFILLDEPTNHLDMDSIDLLTNALTQYEGTILFVSHDREFINSICTHVFVMLKDGRCHLFHGDLNDYRILTEKIGFPDVFKIEEESTSQSKPADNNINSNLDKKSNLSTISHDDHKKLKSNARKYKSALEEIEKKQKDYEKEMKNIDKNLVDSDQSDFSKIQELSIRRQELAKNINECEDQWLEFTDSLEKAEKSLSETRNR